MGDLKNGAAAPMVLRGEPERTGDGGMDLGLTDRVYVVAGAARGLGRACAEQLALKAPGWC